MKFSELSFADMAALELLPVVINSRHFLHQPDMDSAYVAAARWTYAQADALAAERDRRNNLHGARASDKDAALKAAIGHIEHMAAWIGAQKAGYCFEALGEDMPGIKAALGQ